MRNFLLLLLTIVLPPVLQAQEGTANAAQPEISSEGGEDGLLELLVDIEKRDAALKEEKGQILNRSNLIARDEAMKACEAVGARSPLEWWQPERLPSPPFIKNLRDSNDIFRKTIVFGVEVYPQTPEEKKEVSTKINEALEKEIKEAIDGARKGITQKEEADKAAAAAESSVRAKATSEDQRITAEAVSEAQIPDTSKVSSPKEGRWPEVMKQFQRSPPDWELFTLKERKDILDDYSYAVDDLEAELMWPYYLEINKDFESLTKHELRITPKVKESGTGIYSVAATWNELISVLFKKPNVRPVPPTEANPKPKPLPPLNPDEIAEKNLRIVARLRARIAELSGENVVVTTKLERVADLLVHLSRYRNQIATTQLVALRDNNKQYSVDLISNHRELTALSAQAKPEDIALAKKKLNDHWYRMQKEVVACATLKTRLNECESIRDKTLVQLEMAIRNNRPALLENAAYQLGKRIRNTISDWDEKHKSREDNWSLAGDVDLEGRDNLRSTLAGHLNTIHLSKEMKPVPQNLLLRNRLIRNGEFQPSTGNLDALITSIAEENGGQIPDEELSCSAIAHRVKLVGHWNLRIEKKKIRRLVLYCHEIEFAQDALVELEGQCEMIIVAHKLIGKPPVLILKDGSSFTFFLSDRFVGEQPCRILGTGDLRILSGGRDGKALDTLPQGAWQWLAGDLPMLRSKMTEYWRAIWSFYLTNHLDEGRNNVNRRIVFVDLAGLPKTVFNNNAADGKLYDSIKNLEKKLAIGSIEQVVDTISKRRIPVFMDRRFVADERRAIYQLPDEIVIHKNGNFYGEWLHQEGEDGKRVLSVNAQARIGVFGAQRGREILKRKFGQNIKVIPIEDAPNFQVVFGDSASGINVAQPEQSATNQPIRLTFQPMDQIGLISYWKRWAAGDMPRIDLTIKQLDDDGVSFEGESFNYSLPINFGRTHPEPKIDRDVEEGLLRITNSEQSGVLLEYGILDDKFDYFDLEDSFLRGGESIETVIPSVSSNDARISRIRGFAAEGPLEIFAIRKSFPGIQYYSLDLEGLLGARFPNKTLKPGYGPAIDSRESTIRFLTKKMNEADEFRENAMYFSGSVASYFSRKGSGEISSGYVVIASSDAEVELEITCVPRFGSSFVEPDQAFKVVYKISRSDRDREIVKEIRTDEFQRRLASVVEKGTPATSSNSDETEN